MAILNRIINILILLAAIAAAVFSYLLFSKREKLIDGWSQMANAVNATAKVLDKDSGTNYSTTDLTAEKLGHANYDNLGSNLKKLNEAVTKVRDQRNDLADVIEGAAGKLAILNLKAAELKNVKNYKSLARVFTQGVEKFRKDRDDLSRGIVEILRTININDVSADKLNDSKTSRQVMASAKSQTESYAARYTLYEENLKKITKQLGFSETDLTGSPDKVLSDTLTKIKKALNDSKNFEKKYNESEKKYKAYVLKAEKNIKDKNEQIKDRDTTIKNLRDTLDRNGTIKLPEKLLTNKDKRECYAYVRGVIEYVDADYGFVTINIGSSYVFVQQYGTVQNPVHFPLEAGKVMTVVRNPDSQNPEPIGKIFVSRVEEKLSVCNLIDGHPERYKAGDTVLFTEDDINKALGGGEPQK